MDYIIHFNTKNRVNATLNINMLKGGVAALKRSMPSNVGFKPVERHANLTLGLTGIEV